MSLVTPVVAGVVGVAIGPGLGVLVDRVPRRASLRGRPTRCGTCDATSARLDLVPVVGWIGRRGRCAGCGARISLRYPLVEAGSGVLFVAAAVRLGSTWQLPAFCVFFASLLALSVIDLEHLIIPNRIVYPTLATIIPLLALAAAADGSWGQLQDAAIGGAAGFGALLAIHLVSPGGMGFGDVRLAGLIGVMLGWLGLRYLLLALFIAFLLAAVVGVGLIVTGLRSRRDAVPFGPFMAMGAVVAVLWGHALLVTYGPTRV